MTDAGFWNDALTRIPLFTVFAVSLIAVVWIGTKHLAARQKEWMSHLNTHDQTIKRIGEECHRHSQALVESCSKAIENSTSAIRENSRVIGRFLERAGIPPSEGG